MADTAELKPAASVAEYIARCRELSDDGKLSWWSGLADALSSLVRERDEAKRTLNNALAVGFHMYVPSAMHMGDCDICGNVGDAPQHIDWKARATAAEAERDEARRELYLARNARDNTADQLHAAESNTTAAEADAARMREALNGTPAAIAWLVRWDGKPLGHFARTEDDALRIIDNLKKYASGERLNIEAVPLIVAENKRGWGWQPLPTAIAALQKIADLPTGETEDVERGHEDAYRAVESLFKIPPKIAVNPSARNALGGKDE